MDKSTYNAWSLVAVIRNNAQSLLSATDRPFPDDALQAYDYLCVVGKALTEFKDTFNHLDTVVYAKAKDTKE